MSNPIEFRRQDNHKESSKRDVDRGQNSAEKDERILKDNVREAYGIDLAEVPTLYSLMRIQQFADAVPENLLQRQVLKKGTKCHFVFGASGMGGEGFTTREGGLSLYMNPFFGVQKTSRSYAERIPGSADCFTPAIFMHEATHAVEYERLLSPETTAAVHQIIALAKEKGASAFMTEYSTSEYSSDKETLSEVLTTISERYIDNPVRFVCDMGKRGNEYKRQLALLMIQCKLLPADALDIKEAIKKLKRRNHAQFHWKNIELLQKRMNTLIERDAEEFHKFFDSPYVYHESLIRQHRAEFEDIEQQLEQLDKKIDVLMIDPEKNASAIEKFLNEKKEIERRKAKLMNDLLLKAHEQAAGIQPLFVKYPIEQNFRMLLMFFCEKGLCPNMARTIRSLMEKRESDVLTMNSKKLQEAVANQNIAAFMRYLHKAAGVEFALQDVLEIHELISQQPKLVHLVSRDETQADLFELQCKGKFHNYDNNLKNFTHYIVEGNLLSELPTYDSYKGK